MGDEHIATRVIILIIIWQLPLSIVKWSDCTQVKQGWSEKRGVNCVPRTYTCGVTGSKKLNVWGCYIYLDDLLTIVRLRPTEVVALPDKLKRTATPL